MENLNLNKSSWQKVKFGDVVIEPKETCKDIVSEGIEHVVGLEHIDSGDMHLRKSASIEQSTTFTKKFRKGDVLFGRRRAYLKKAAQADFNGICSGDITVFRAQKNLLPELLPFIVNNDKYFDHAIKHSAGGLSPRVKFKDLANYDFLLPPKEEQAKIAELLWAMDDVIEKEKGVLEKQKNVFLSYSELIFSNGNGKLIELSKIGKLTMGQSPDSATYNEIGNGMPFLQGNAEFGALSPTFVKYTTNPNKIVPENSILISVRAPVGDLNIADRECCIGRGLAGLFIENESLRNYVFNFLKYSKTELDKRSTGSTFKAVNKEALSTLNLVIPSENLIQENSNKLSMILCTIENLNSKIKSSQSLQKSLINQIF